MHCCELNMNSLAQLYLKGTVQRELREGSAQVSNIKDCGRPFGWGVESRLIRSVLINWSAGHFLYSIL